MSRFRCELPIDRYLGDDGHGGVIRKGFKLPNVSPVIHLERTINPGIVFKQRFIFFFSSRSRGQHLSSTRNPKPQSNKTKHRSALKKLMTTYYNNSQKAKFLFTQNEEKKIT